MKEMVLVCRGIRVGVGWVAARDVAAEATVRSVSVGALAIAGPLACSAAICSADKVSGVIVVEIGSITIRFSVAAK